MSAKRRVLFLVLCLLLSGALTAMSAYYCCDNDYAFGKTTFSARPQGNYYFTTFMATADITHHPQREQNYFNCTAILGYRQNMDSYELGRYFLTQTGPLIFGNVNTDVDVQNLQLGLANNYKGTLTMQPSVHDAIIDLDFFAGFDAWVNGAWLRINLPFAHNSWCPCIQSQTQAIGTAYPDGFADTAGTKVPIPYSDCAQATCGDQPFGLIPALSAGKLCNCKKTVCGLSDVHLELGYDFIRKERGNMGAALIGAIGTGQPTGKSCNNYLLRPTIGTQNSSQLGAALRAQYILMNFEDGKKITLFGDARISHVFPGCTKRLLNLSTGNNTAFNYWLLLNEYAYDGTYVGVERAANLLNKKVKVSANAMGEATIMIQTKQDNWDLAFGYNFWGRSKEHLTIMDPVIGNESNYYTLKNTSTWGTSLIDKNVGNICEQPTNASYTASLTNIKKYALTTGNIDVCTAQHPATFSNSFFVGANYKFDDMRCQPYIGIGGHVEWGCGNIALNTWGIYLHGALSI